MAIEVVTRGTGEIFCLDSRTAVDPPLVLILTWSPPQGLFSCLALNTDRLFGKSLLPEANPQKQLRRSPPSPFLLPDSSLILHAGFSRM